MCSLSHAHTLLSTAKFPSRVIWRGFEIPPPNLSEISPKRLLSVADGGIGCKNTFEIPQTSPVNACSPGVCRGLLLRAAGAFQVLWGEPETPVPETGPRPVAWSDLGVHREKRKQMGTEPEPYFIHCAKNLFVFFKHVGTYFVLWESVLVHLPSLLLTWGLSQLSRPPQTVTSTFCHVAICSFDVLHEEFSLRLLGMSCDDICS